MTMTPIEAVYAAAVPGIDPPEGVDTADVLVSTHDLQALLRDQGFDPGRVDGQYGPRTEAALVLALRAAGLAVNPSGGPTGGWTEVSPDGESVSMSDDTWATLHEVTGPGTASASSASDHEGWTTLPPLPASAYQPRATPSWVPWAVGGAVLLVVGVGAMYAGSRHR